MHRMPWCIYITAHQCARMMKSCNQRSWHDTLNGFKGNAMHALVPVQHRRAQMRARMMKSRGQQSWHDALNGVKGNATHALMRTSRKYAHE